MRGNNHVESCDKLDTPLSSRQSLNSFLNDIYPHFAEGVVSVEKAFGIKKLYEDRVCTMCC